MRKVFLDSLPKHYNGGVDWTKAIGEEVKFIYDDISGVIKIINIDKKQNLTVSYNGKNSTLKSYTFTSAKICRVIGKITTDYKFCVGDIVDTHNSKIQIISYERMKNNIKAYKYKCLKCGLIHKISEYDINKNVGCPVCCKDSRLIIDGVNDLWTTHPHIATLLSDKSIGNKVTHGTVKKYDFICPICNRKRKYSINAAVKAGYVPCQYCSDGFSYPEKFMATLLKQCNINYEPQIVFEWSNKFRYDFYLNDFNMIIETHGMQHFNHTGFYRTLDEEKANDDIKQCLALNNGIKNYVQLDCRFSTMQYIKESIYNNELLKILNIQYAKIDWELCDIFASGNLLKISCDLYNSGETTDYISSKLNISKTTVYRYLSKGKKLGICKDKELQKIIQFSLSGDLIKIWDSQASATRMTKITNINSCLKGRYKTAGGYIWKYAD